jgi:hypothetical protein
MDYYPDLISFSPPRDYSAPPEPLPGYIAHRGGGEFECLWCRKSLCGGTLIAHLTGKEHRKRCANSCIPPYEDPTHARAVDDYVRRYGHDPYARFDHWPPHITDDGAHWTCRRCGKKSQTQLGVELHLEESCGARVRPRDESVSTGGEAEPRAAWSRGADWRDSIVDRDDHWECVLCNKRFNNAWMVDSHIRDTRHRQREESVRDPRWPECIARSADQWLCNACDSLFNSRDAVSTHLVSARHIQSVSALAGRRAMESAQAILAQLTPPRDASMRSVDSEGFRPYIPQDSSPSPRRTVVDLLSLFASGPAPRERRDLKLLAEARMARRELEEEWIDGRGCELCITRFDHWNEAAEHSRTPSHIFNSVMNRVEVI